MYKNEKTLCKDIGNRIIQILDKRNMTQRTLAIDIEKSEAYLSRRFNLNVAWSVTDLYQIAAALDVDVKELLPLEAVHQEPSISDDTLLVQFLSAIISALQAYIHSPDEH